MKFMFVLFIFLAHSAHAFDFFQGPFSLNPSGETRKAANVFLPLQYNENAGQKKWPLIILLHGYSGTADSEDRQYLMLRYRVSTRGFILVVPEGTADKKGNHFWNATDTCCDFDQSNVNDVDYLLKIIALAKLNYKVDPSRVYLIGHSNGGYMANRLACEQSGVIAGIASLAGGTYKDPTKCRLKEPISYLQIHAENDPTVSYSDTPAYAGGLATVHQWVTRNNCLGDPTQGTGMKSVLLIPGFAKDTSVLNWKACEKGTEVALWTIKKYESPKGDPIQYQPHIPIPSLTFMDSVISFLFTHTVQ
jgi:polyhydroxybutyrate depolymerase